MDGKKVCMNISSVTLSLFFCFSFSFSASLTHFIDRDLEENMVFRVTVLTVQLMALGHPKKWGHPMKKLSQI